MGALSIAFDIIIVGALALPWVLLIIHLFFLPGEKALDTILGWVTEKDLQAVAAVLLFAVTFTLGSAVSRMAQDFFNDDDLHVPSLLRMAMTEDRIVASVYCASDQRHLLDQADANAVLAPKITRFHCLRENCCVATGTSPLAPAPAPTQAPNQPSSPTPGASAPDTAECCAKDQSTAGAIFVKAGDSPKPDCACDALLNPTNEFTRGRQNRQAARNVEKKLIAAAGDIFGLQENALLLKGEDATQRLRQFHDQIMVLRGATYDGLLAFTFCMFAWGAQMPRRSIQRWLLGLFPVLILFLGVNALFDHYEDAVIAGPPYMEFSLLVVGLAGVVLLWIPNWLPQRNRQEENDDEETIHWNWPAMSLLFAVLVVGGLFGWWATEVIYGQDVIYSYSASTAAAK